MLSRYWSVVRSLGSGNMLGSTGGYVRTRLHQFIYDCQHPHGQQRCMASQQQDEITFKIYAEDEDDWLDGYNPYVELADPHEGIAKMHDASDIVIPKPKICVAVNYPLRQEYLFILRAKNSRKGFTRKELALKVSQLYQDIYEIEARTEYGPSWARRLMHNPDAVPLSGSHGQYGIGYHGLSDLGLSAVIYNASADVYELVVDS